jgi:uncharacterized SAM-binding protein YcdF (DUF218 family)
MRCLFRTIAGVVGVLLLMGALTFAWLMVRINDLGRRDDAHPADVIVALGARVEPDGSAGPDLMGRTQHAAELWRAGYAPQLICTGGYKDDQLSAAAVCRRVAMQLGVPGSRIWLADGSQSTVEDARSTAAVMAAHGWRSAILVSHPLHLYRARWLFEKAGVVVFTSPTTTQVDSIGLPWRIWYGVREAGAILLTNLQDRGLLPATWTQQLQSWSYEIQ